MSQAVRFILRTKLNILRRERVYIVRPTLLPYLTIRPGIFEKRNKQTKKHRSFRVTIFFFFKFECGKNFLSILFIKSLPNSFY